MSVRKQLFGPYRDWLEQTLSHTGPELPICEVGLPDRTRLTRHATGVLEIAPCAVSRQPQYRPLILSAGIHGNETAPVEILNSLLDELLDQHWQPACAVLLILGNPPAMQSGTRYIDTNLNRLFNGSHREPVYRDLPEGRRALLLETLCRSFLARHSGPADHYDLHTAIRPSHREKFALYPFVPGRTVPEGQLSFLREAQIDTLLLQHRRATTFASFTAELGAESFTLELGRVMPFGKNDHSRFRGITEALRRRLQGKPPQEKGHRGMTVFEVVHEILNTGDRFRLLVPDDAENFTRYPPGTLIWEDGEAGYRVGAQPEFIVFPNREVPVGQRAGLMVRPVPSAAH